VNSAPMLPAVGTTVSVCHSDDRERNRTAPGVVTGLLADAVVVRLAESADLPVDALSLVYAPPGGETVALTDVLARWNPDRPGRELIFHRIKRETLRVTAPPKAYAVDVGEHRRCPVLDLGFGGLAVRSPVALEADSRVHVRLCGDDSARRGEFRVCHVQALRCGRYRCGLELVEDQGRMSGWLRSEVMRIQRSRLQHGVDVVAGDLPASAAEQDDGDGVGAYIDVRISLDLLVNRPLPFSIIAEDGRVVCEAASVLDEAALEELRDTLVSVGELVDIEPETTADQHGSAGGDREKRAHKRSVYRKNATVQLLSKNDRRLLEVETLDISCGGLSFRSSSMIYEGMPIMLMLSPSERAPWILARVKHCARIGNGYRVGVSFMQSSLQNWEAPEPEVLRELISALGSSMGSDAAQRSRVSIARFASGVSRRLARARAAWPVRRWRLRRRDFAAEVLCALSRWACPALCPAYAAGA